MSHNQLDTLIRMINQIAANNGAYPHDEAAERVANHVKRFWARSMKTMIRDYRQRDGAELSPITADAVDKLAQTAEKQSQSVASSA